MNNYKEFQDVEERTVFFLMNDPNMYIKAEGGKYGIPIYNMKKERAVTLEEFKKVAIGAKVRTYSKYADVRAEG